MNYKNFFPILIFILLCISGDLFSQRSKWSAGIEVFGIQPTASNSEGVAPLSVYFGYQSMINERWSFQFRPGIIMRLQAPQIDLLMRYTFPNYHYLHFGVKISSAWNEERDIDIKIDQQLSYAVGVGLKLVPFIDLTITHYGGTYIWFGFDFKF